MHAPARTGHAKWMGQNDGECRTAAMAPRIEDYAIIGNTRTAALVNRDGSIDWLCTPRFDSGACFAALLGDRRHGRWLLAPAGEHRVDGRRYRDDTLVLETGFSTDGGAVRVADAMPVRDRRSDVVRLVEGVRGRVRMRGELAPRFDYGQAAPWLRVDGRRACALAGPDTVFADADVPFTVADDDVILSEFEVGEGERVGLRLQWVPPRQSPSAPGDIAEVIAKTTRWWQEWTGRCGYRGRYRTQVIRSLITLKALTYAPSGGMVAAATTSLPERLGGVRNWDYRYCWIRDATFTLLSLLDAGYVDEAAAWREWLGRAVAGRPEHMQLMYGVEGERRVTETELDLPGFAGSRPVRIGNRAGEQFQLDVYGELMDAVHQARACGLPPDENAWQVQRALLDFLEGHWREPDNGIWETRGPRRDFTHSKVMAWTAVDRAVREVEEFGMDGPAEDWKRLRQEIFQEVCERGYDADRGTFTRYYGSAALDAALLLIPQVGFLPATDERVRGTVAAVERELCRDGFVQRYGTTGEAADADGLPPGEGAFLACTLWLADCHILAGDTDRGRALLERLLGLANDVGLLSEEYDTAHRRLLGNFPQALSHMSLVNTALNLERRGGPAHQRARGEGSAAADRRRDGPWPRTSPARP